MPLSTAQNNGTLTLHIRDRFDFSLHRDFRAAHEGAGGVSHYVVDLTQAGYMDSSALGMLLLLREWAQGCGADIRIVTGSPIVRKVLATAHFDKLFQIE